MHRVGLCFVARIVFHVDTLLQVAQTFSVRLSDVEDQQHCRQFVHSLLQEKAQLTPAVGLLLHFPVSTLLICISQLVMIGRVN